MQNPFRCFNSSPEVIRLTVMMYIRYPLSLRQVEDLLFERGIGICHEMVRFWWNRSNGAAHLHSGNSKGIRIRLTTPVNSAIGTPILTKSMKP